MIKLKPETWYYIYTDEKHLFISDVAPIRDNKKRHHPKLSLKATRQVFYVPDLDSLRNVVEFYDNAVLYVPIVEGSKEATHDKEN